jgi:hypothetical protein
MMKGYDLAKKCFQENVSANRASDVQTHNLNTGLLSLTVAVEQDIASLRSILRDVLREVSRKQ